MTIGVGGSTAEAELAAMDVMSAEARPIDDAEYARRVEKAQSLMAEQGIDALYLDASPNLFYFTGLSVKPSERLHGAILPREGPIVYLSPSFEEPKTRSMLRDKEAPIRVWEEDADPTSLVIATVADLTSQQGVLAIDPATPFFQVDGMRRAGNRFELTNGASVTAACRSVKSPAEIELLRHANAVTLEVHKAAARIMREGITSTEVEDFVLAAHARLGATPPGSRPLVLFGEASAYPHGVDYPQTLEDGDMVLIDAGGFVNGYRSDITRSYVFGSPSPRQRNVWELERTAQRAGFEAAVPGAPCGDVDRAARDAISGAGFGPAYALPGLPHRTGHGIGLEVHEERYMVAGNPTPLETGFCFSIEPTICIYGEFGIRLEDCAYMTDNGAAWFTEPCGSVEDPFNLGSA
ncbi:Xaa-Pro dipeptidase [Palleronia aestuarii]|uniref:Xaa-Pro dipeptidase n=1 Tax=Palleronia aestuarii TaxID=568105 RepID=A0A2W7P935_9RHOB|nr:Xaa-Pro peptidase family protein [Palleronia aestuarii]PZX19872.1 Xaa-Pro dipeptidase [Palleronia aestuarii]